MSSNIFFPSDQAKNVVFFGAQMELQNSDGNTLTLALDTGRINKICMFDPNH